MSTTFYVYPGKEYLPTFSELLDISNKRINDFLTSLGSDRSVIVDAEVHNSSDHSQIKFNMNDKLNWNDDSYAWFFVHGVGGGTDSYYYTITELDKEAWKEELETNIKAQQLQNVINRSIRIGYYWSFRRSTGQAGIINLAYGIIAASLAEITDGFVYSDDGAWDYNCLPALADDFFKWYFKPEFTEKSENKTWVQNSIKSIRKELK